MIGRLVNGLAAVVGAAIGAQFPAFYLQYLQRLGGRLDQARIEESRIRSAAGALGRRVVDFIAQLANSPDATQRAAGALHQQTLDDVARLSQAHTALGGATGIERPIVLARHFDPSVAQATLASFEPSLPLTVEGAIYAGLGVVLALVVAVAIEGLVGTAGRRRKRAAAR